MVKLGEVFWVASVKGGDDAADTASGLQDNLEGVAESAVGAASAQNDYGGQVEENTKRTEEANRWTSKLDSSTGLLGSALFFAADMFGVAGVATTLYEGALALATRGTALLTGSSITLSGALGTVSGAATTAWAAIAGPAGLAAGLFLAVVGVGLLGSELLGLTDVTPVVQSETDTMTSTFADLAFLVGGPLVGYMSAAFSALTGDWTAAKNKFVNTSVEWAKAATRFTSKAILGFQAFGIAVKTGIGAAVEAADYVWRAGWNGILTFSQGIVNDIANSIIGGIEGAINSARGGLNSLIQKVNMIPKVSIDPVGRVSLGGRNPLDVGAGTVQNESMSSRMARVRNRGNRQLRSATETARARLDRFAPDTIGGSRQTARPGEQPGTNVQEQNVSVSVDGSNGDFSNMSRSERKELARMIGEEVGSNTGDLAGGK